MEDSKVSHEVGLRKWVPRLRRGKWRGVERFVSGRGESAWEFSLWSRTTVIIAATGLRDDLEILLERVGVVLLTSVT